MTYIYKIVGLLCILLASTELQSQVNIGLTSPPESAALLQLKQIEPRIPSIDNQTVTMGGLMLPRVKLQELTSLAPLLTSSEIAAADYPKQKLLHVGAIVYNTAVIPAKDLLTGTYVWDGEQWMFQKAQVPSNFNLLTSISSAEFPSGLTPQSITSKPVKISWTPLSGKCSVSNDPILNGGVNYTPPTQLTTNPQTLNIVPLPMTIAETRQDPFREKVSTLNITLMEGGGSETKKVIIRQTHYSIQAVNWEVGVASSNKAELGKEYTIKLRTNTDWKVEVNKPALFADLGVYPQAGVANTTTGVEYKFRLLDNDANEGQIARLTFKSQENGKCSDLIINLLATREYPNAYMIAPGTSFVFPVKKAYKAWREDAELKLSGIPAGTLGAKLIWQDEQSLIQSSSGVSITGLGENALISVKTTAGKKGNALIAFTINNVIYWSWHLWITDYDPTTVLEHSFDPSLSQEKAVSGGKVYSYFNSQKATVLMDRNLGATTTALGSTTSVGNMYFWGRKDPFPSASIYNVGTGNQDFRMLYDINNNRVSDFSYESTDFYKPKTVLIPAIQNPKTSYNGSASDNDADWYSNVPGVHRDDFWLNADGTKSIFDPCPKGWRVPSTGSGTENPMYGVPMRTPPGSFAGLDYSDLKLGILPASARSSRFSGAQALFFNGKNSLLQTNTVVGGHASFIATDSGSPNNQIYERQYAYALRCVRDESTNK